MKSKINNEVQFGQSLNPLDNVVKVSSIDNSPDLKDVFTKIDKLKKLWDDGMMDFDLIRYLPGISSRYQREIYDVLPKKPTPLQIGQTCYSNGKYRNEF